MNQKKVKILVAYHKPSALFKDEVLTPIHLGRALSKEAHKDGKVSDEDFAWLCENMIGDDTGENISHLNRYFNEMTGIYWAWKNYDKLGNPDYIGFMSYRCLFYLRKRDADNSPIGVGKHQLPYYNFNNFSDFYWSDKDTQEILNLIKGYDYITNLPVINRQNVEEQYKNTDSLSVGHIPKDIETLKNIIAQDFPRYKQNFENYLAGFENYFSNSFIMKKELFFEYCEFIFPILFKYHQSIDYTHRNLEQSRMFVSERLTGAFYQMQKKSHKRGYVPIGVVNNPHLFKFPLPKFISNNIPIVFAVDYHYLPYLYVAIVSLIENSSPDYNYDICILYTALPKESQKHFDSLNRNNISVRFINISSKIGEIWQKFPQNIFSTRGHMSATTYYRFLIPLIFKNFEKVVYLDSDMIILNDIANLYKTDLNGNILAATKEIGIDCMLNQGDKKLEKYLSETLGLQDLSHYFQAGVLIYDIPQCHSSNLMQKSLEKLNSLNKKLRMNDQCVLNSLFENQIQFLPFQWNYTWNIPIKYKNYPKYLPVKLTSSFKKASKEPFIIHYNDNFKPWSHPHLPLADIWWDYARKTPFYEEMLVSLNNQPCGAEARIKNHLSYKIGLAIIQAKNPMKAILLPITLITTIIQHKIDYQIYKAVSRFNPSIKNKPLMNYRDYEQGIKCKRHLSFILGNALLSNPFSFPFKVKKIYKKFKEERM